MRYSADRLAHLMLNAWFRPLEFRLPPPSTAARGDWKRLIDTSLPSPDDIAEPGLETPVGQDTYTVEARSLVLLIAPLDI